MYNIITDFIKSLYPNEKPVPIHAPRFIGNERKYVLDAIDTSYVSSVGSYVNKVEYLIKNYTACKYAIPIVNGTSALHLALLLAGVSRDDEVITQAVTFVATCNAIKYCNAEPVFVDIDNDTLGMSPDSLNNFLKEFSTTKNNDGYCYNKKTGNRISVCVPMYTFGHPARIEDIKKICDNYNIKIVEDAAESVGSLYKNKHTGTFGLMGVLSFNGNKTITSGGGGAIITNDEAIGVRAKHLSTTGKVPHKWEYVHDSLAYNYRMPNINAALLCAQFESLNSFIENKRKLAKQYKSFFSEIKIDFIKEPLNSYSNFWLNSILFKDRTERDKFLEYSNKNGVTTRPLWTMINKLDMYKICQTYKLENSQFIEDRLVNIPSSVTNI